eukprot:355326-Chlamydomonas_euryale.AAC.1
MRPRYAGHASCTWHKDSQNLRCICVVTCHLHPNAGLERGIKSREKQSSGAAPSDEPARTSAGCMLPITISCRPSRSTAPWSMGFSIKSWTRCHQEGRAGSVDSVLNPKPHANFLSPA